MTELTRVLITNLQHSADCELAKIAEAAKNANDEETLKSLLVHPRAGFETFQIIFDGFDSFDRSGIKIQEIVLSNPNSPDDILAKIAEEAKSSNDEETLRKLKIHPRAGAKTLEVIYN